MKFLVDGPHNSNWTSIYRYDNAQSLMQHKTLDADVNVRCNYLPEVDGV